jgi:serine/threonine protein kinase/tetratricopeptide (TPR) repeat protein
MIEESVFIAALEKPTTTERQAFLDEACAHDISLRRRVERLLEAHRRTLGILDRSAGTPGWIEDDRGPATGDARWGERAGTLIAGRYRLLEEIGDGGMGTVWKAEQTQPVRRIVALKLIKAGMDSRMVLSRFEAERQALALMDHPNISRVLDGGTTEVGRPFFVMEYVPGVPFTGYCDDARLGIAQRLELFVSVCQAVQHAHTKGVIHRDLKPSNILVCPIDGLPVPKVIDFGLAKAIQEPLTEETLITAHGALVGTPLYMSPEQAELHKVDVDARTDVYALGVILYELLTGTTPLERRRLQEVAWHELPRLIKEEEPPRPSARLGGDDSLTEVAARRRLQPARLIRLVRGELDWIVMKCLEKDRSRRYETPDGLARDIRRYLDDESVEACPPSAGYRLGKFVRRNRAAVLVASIVLLFLLGGIGGTTWGLIRADRARKAEADRALGEEVANARAQKRLQQIEKGSEILTSVFRDLDPRAEEKEGRPLRAILGDRLDQAAAALEGDAVGDPLVVATLQDRLGRTYRALGHAVKAKAMLTQAVAIRRAQLGPDHPDTLKVMSQQAAALFDVGELREAIALYEQVRDAQVRSLGADHRDTLATESSLAMAYRKAGRSSEACTLLERVRDALTEKYGPEDAQTVDTLDHLSAVYMTIDRVTEAIALAEQVRDYRVKNYGYGHYLTISSLHDLGSRYQAAGKMRQALALFEEARDRIVPRLGAEHPSSLSILDSLARMYRAFGRNAEAVALAEKVRDSRVMTLGAYHPDSIYSMDNLGKAYQAAGEPEKALALFQRAAAGLEKLEFAHAAADVIIFNVCDCLEGRGQFDQADVWRRKWLDAAKRRNGPDSPGYAVELARQGENMLRHRRHADAEPILREGVAILQKEQPGEARTSLAQSLLGEVLLEQKKYDAAEPLLLRGYEGLKALEGRMSPLYARFRIAQAGERIVRLYQSWGKAEKAAEWRSRVPELGHGHPMH